VLFIGDLFRAGMIAFTRFPRDLVSPFCVWKKTGKQRLVWDCRLVNRRFKPPSKLRCAVGARLAELSLPPGETAFCGPE